MNSAFEKVLADAPPMSGFDRTTLLLSLWLLASVGAIVLSWRKTEQARRSSALRRAALARKDE